MCAYGKAIPLIDMHAMSPVPLGPFLFHLGNKQMPVRYWYFLPASAQYNSNFMNKISTSSQVF